MFNFFLYSINRIQLHTCFFSLNNTGFFLNSIHVQVLRIRSKLGPTTCVIVTNQLIMKTHRNRMCA